MTLIKIDKNRILKLKRLEILRYSLLVYTLLVILFSKIYVSIIKKKKRILEHIYSFGREIHLNSFKHEIFTNMFWLIWVKRTSSSYIYTQICKGQESRDRGERER